ncbi:MAG: hypothetical protein JXR76_02120 [Deltaproteobacteria bacterium]|nr:hypothetical protein [Deltaproteobacteria bacterium]
MDIEKLHAECLLAPLTDAMFKNACASLNERFTIQRNRLTGYGTDDGLVSAYTAFYMPTNMKKLSFVLDRLSRLPLKEDTPLEVIDFGCGPGTFGFALYDILQSGDINALASTPIVRYHFVDTAPGMLRQAKKIQQHLYPQMDALFTTSVPAAKQHPEQRLVLLGNVANEMNTTALEMLLKELAADVLVFVEPGTRASFVQMRSLRAGLLAEGYRIVYPCPTQEACPLNGGGDDWCHQVLKASLEPAVARLGQLAGLDRTVMPFIGHVYTRSQTRSQLAELRQSALLFRLKTHSKHAFFWEVCMATQEGLQLKKVELPKRSHSRQAQKALEHVCAGQRIRFEVEKTLGNGTLRIRNVEVT